MADISGEPGYDDSAGKRAFGTTMRSAAAATVTAKRVGMRGLERRMNRDSRAERDLGRQSVMPGGSGARIEAGAIDAAVWWN